MPLIEIIALGYIINLTTLILKFILSIILTLPIMNSLEEQGKFYLVIDRTKAVISKVPRTHMYKELLILFLPFAKVLELFDFISNLSKANWNMTMYMYNYTEYLIEKYNLNEKDKND